MKVEITVKAVCEKCSHTWDLEMKPMETIICPNCKTVYNALKVVNDSENEEVYDVVIREDYGEWREPLVEVEE